MAFKFSKRRWHKITVIALLAFAAFTLILGFVVNYYWSPILAKEVKKVVLKSSDGLYEINFSSAELHFIRGTLDIYNITLKPDTAVYNRLKKQHLAPNNLVELYVKRLTLSHMHPIRLYFKHRLEIGEIILREPVLNVSYQLNHVKDTTVKDNRTAWQKISKNLSLIHIGSIKLGDVKLRYEDYSGNNVAISELKELNLSANDLLIDSATQTDRSRLLYCKDIIAELNNYTGKTSSGLYTYKIRSLKLSTLTSQLNVTGLTLQPIGTDKFFSNGSSDRFTLRLDSVQLNHFDFLNYHKYRIFNASRMVISGGAIQIFSNPHKRKDESDKIKTFPNVALRKINSDMKIDTVLFHHINVLYNEYNTKSNHIGDVIFNNTDGYILNLCTNKTNKTALEKNNISTVQLTSYFMNRGKLDVNFAFNLTDSSNTFSYKGSLGPMDLKFANPAAMPLGMVKITSGTLKQFSFDIHANSTSDKGKIELLYNDLTVSLLKPDTVFDNLKKKPIATLFANLFIIKHNNPDTPGERPRSVYVNYTRTKETPFFGSLWQTLFTGIKSCAGFDQKTQQAVIAMTNEQAVKKQNRKIQKEQRIQKRAERRRKKGA